MRWPVILLCLLLSGLVQANSIQVDFDIDKILARKLKKPAKNHPDYPAYEILRFLTSKKYKTPKERINKFEQILTSKQFQVLVEKNQGGQLKLTLGSKGSFSLWRDTLYLILGRAYYENKQYKKALSYFSYVQPESNYYTIASLHYNYSAFANNEMQKAKDRILAMKQPVKEMNLQMAFINAREKKFDEAINFCEKVTFKKKQVESIRLKILAEAYFGKYIRDYSKMKFNQKLSSLEKMLKTVEAVPEKYRDGKLAYMAAESYWHMAVAYRLEDPIKFEKKWFKQLEIANEWITPYVKKSIKYKQAYLSEEAYFFSIALLWERQKPELGLKRLEYLPQIYPQGIYREDSYQLLGDYYFEKQNFKRAVTYYRKLANIGVESKAAYGVYKAAWSFYNDKKKWKSLRHFERLFEHYQKMSPEERLDRSELAKEARQDMLLVISEIMKAKEGIKELDVFKLTYQEKLDMVHDLAKSYQAIGSFKDSIYTWNYLLSNHMKEERSHEWIIGLMKDYQADGKRIKVTEAIKKHYPKWKLLKLPGNEKIFSEWTKIILSIHKEARKTDDPRYWKATDLVYNTYEELNPNGQNGEVWFYGAQKFQRQNKLWRSIEWFKRAADTESFKLRDDAALTVLNLISSENDELSIKEDKSKKQWQSNYKKVNTYSKWFMEQKHERLNKQKELARLIYTETNHYLNDHQTNKLFIQSQFMNPKADTWNLYLVQNKRLYQEEDWIKAHEYAKHLGPLKNKLTKEQQQLLINFKQETAFQIAFTQEKDKKVKHPVAQIRKWYTQAFDMRNASKDIELKAWHNYLLTFNKEEIVEFEEQLLEFQDRWKEAKDEDQRSLLYNIYSKAFRNFDEAKLFYKKMLYLPIAANYTTDPVTKESMAWEAFVLSAAYYEWDEFDKLYALLINKKSSYLSKENNKLFVARSFFYRKEFETSWTITKTLMKNPTPAVWTLIIDHFRLANSSTKKQIASFLKDNEKEYKKVDLLKPLWGQMDKERFFDTIEDALDKDFERKPASIGENDADFVIKLKEKLAQINNAYGLMNQTKTNLNALLMKDIPQTGQEISCRMPKITQEAIEEVKEVKEDPINSPQWPAFVKKVEEKLNELDGIYKKEMATCNKLKNELLFFGDYEPHYTPFCDNDDCLFDEDPDLDDILKIEKTLLTKNSTSSLEKFMLSLSEGAFTYAEFLAASEEDKEQQVFMYGMIRLALSDYWNAYSIMLSFKKEPKWSQVSSFVLRMMAKKKQNRDVASKYKFQTTPQVKIIQPFFDKN
jgi:hypothetical protein